MLHLGFVYQVHVAETAVGKLVDDGTAHEIRQIVVDEGTDIGSEGSEQDHLVYIEVAVSACSLIGSRWNHHFRREGDEGTLDGHQQGDGPIIQVVEAPLDECDRFHNDSLFKDSFSIMQ
jgi:hypothetical protein